MTVEILAGDALERLGDLPSDHFHCVVTSPPYFGLRQYLDDDHPDRPLMIGLEPTVDEWLGKLVAVMAEVRRVLRPDGLCAVNMGDKWASGGNGGGGKQSIGAVIGWAQADGFKQGDLISQSHMLFEAMRQDGWYHRQTLIWHKRAPMPSSDRGWVWSQHRALMIDPERPGMKKLVDCPGCDECEPHDGMYLYRHSWKCTPAHEYIGLFSRQRQYFTDSEAVREADVRSDHRRSNDLGPKDTSNGYLAPHTRLRTADGRSGGGRNPRSVRTIGPEPFAGDHYAAFPTELPRWIIRAACSSKGCCSTCGAQVARVIRSKFVPQPDVCLERGVRLPGQLDESRRDAGTQRGTTSNTTIGWRETCDCKVWYCRACCVVVEQPYDTTQHYVRNVRDHNADQQAQAEILRGDLCPKSEQDVDGSAVSSLREDVSSQEPSGEMLQSCVQREGGAQTSREPRIHDHDQGLQDDPQARSPERSELRIRDGASAGDGETSGSIIDGRRSGSPHQWGSAGQPSGKSGVNGQEAARRKSETDVHSAVSSLSKDVSDARQCPHCGSCLERTTPPRSPCKTLDPFSGTGTTAVAAEQLGHDCTLIELNPRYVEMARQRIASQRARRMIGDRAPLFEDDRQRDMFGSVA